MFDWRAYVEKDWREEEDAADPTDRFGINLRNSIDVGVNRTVPDNRYVQLRSISIFTYNFPHLLLRIVVLYHILIDHFVIMG